MKEATGELSTTVIAVVAIAAVLTIFVTFLLPTFKSGLRARTYCSQAVACGTCNNGKTNCSYYDDNMTLVDNLVCDCKTGGEE